MASITNEVAAEPTPLTNLKDHLRVSGRRLDWFASKVGMSVWHVSRVVNGHARATPQFKRLAARALDVPETFLFPARAGKRRAA